MSAGRERLGRNEIKHEIGEQKDDMGEHRKTMDTFTRDAETAREVFERLKRGGTSEGIDQTDEHIKQADRAAVDLFKGEDTDLEQDHGRVNDYEGMLRGRKETDDSDLDKVSGGIAKVESRDPAQELQKAQEKLQEDIEVLGNLVDTAHEALEESKREQEALKARIQSKGIS